MSRARSSYPGAVDGHAPARRMAGDLEFPNGMVITPDNSTLINATAGRCRRSRLFDEDNVHEGDFVTLQQVPVELHEPPFLSKDQPIDVGGQYH